MKNKIFKIGFILIVLISILGGCETENVDRRSDCYPEREIVKEAVDVKGMVGVMTNKPDVWKISSMEGIIGHDGPTYDSRDVVIPCNLPEEFKEEGLMVEFSGILIDPKDDFTGGPVGGFYEDLYYAELSEISSCK